jgi:hypothetical protein
MQTADSSPREYSVAVRSSSLSKLAYDPQDAILQVEFRDGRVYQYAGVPLQTYLDLLQADSKGAFFNHHIRSRFPHRASRATGRILG